MNTEKDNNPSQFNMRAASLATLLGEHEAALDRAIELLDAVMDPTRDPDLKEAVPQLKFYRARLREKLEARYIADIAEEAARHE